MNRNSSHSLVPALLALAVLAACQPTSPGTDTAAIPAPAAPAPAATPAAPPTDLEQLAQRIVNQSAGVQEGDIVLLSARSDNAELLEDIAVNVRKLGAFPIVQYNSDRLNKRLFFDVPAKYDDQADAANLKLAGIANVVITLGDGTSEALFEGADPARMAAMSKANEVVGETFRKNNVRSVEIGNGLYPTAWRAERFGMAGDALRKAFWEGVNIDYSELQSRGDQVKAALAVGNEVHITHPNGTDLTLRIQGRPVLVSDGIISEADRKAGGAALAAYLPAGEVYTTPVAGSAEGKIVHTHDFFRGKQIDNLTLTFVGGKLVSMTGSGPGFADMKANYDAVADERKNLFGFVDIGINPNFALPAGSKIGHWIPAGMVTVGAGGNTWAGGDNAVGYGYTAFLPGSTVTLDGKTIIDAGVLKI